MMNHILVEVREHTDKIQILSDLEEWSEDLGLGETLTLSMDCDSEDDMAIGSGLWRIEKWQPDGIERD